MFFVLNVLGVAKSCSRYSKGPQLLGYLSSKRTGLCGQRSWILPHNIDRTFVNAGVSVTRQMWYCHCLKHWRHANLNSARSLVFAHRHMKIYHDLSVAPFYPAQDFQWFQESFSVPWRTYSPRVPETKQIWHNWHILTIDIVIYRFDDSWSFLFQWQSTRFKGFGILESRSIVWGLQESVSRVITSTLSPLLSSSLIHTMCDIYRILTHHCKIWVYPRKWSFKQQGVSKAATAQLEISHGQW